MDKSTTPTRRAKRKIVLEEESCESPQKVLIKFVSVEECGLIEDCEQLRRNYKPILSDILEEDDHSASMINRNAKGSFLLKRQGVTTHTYGFETPKKSNQMNERTAQVLQNSASKLPMSPLAIANRSPTSLRKSGQSSGNVTPVKISGTPSRGPRTPMSLRKAVLTTPLKGLQLTADGPPTPLTTRRRLKKDIIKLTEENDEIDEDSESESSEEDSSEEENIAPLKNANAAGTPSSTPERTRKKEQSRVNSESYFLSQSGGKIVTSDKTLSNLKNARLSKEALHHMLSGEKLRFQMQIDNLLKDYATQYSKWMLLLSQNFNIVLYGLGSKRSLLGNFHSKMLSGDDVVIVNGYFPSITLKQILNGITSEVIGNDETFSTTVEQVQFILKNLQEPLFLIIHNIDGPMLRGEKNQSLISKLAEHPKIRLICSIDHLNAPLLWDQDKLSLLNFVWFDCTTFLPYTEETLNENSLMVKQSGALALNSLARVFASLTPNAKGIYIIIVKNQIAGIEESGSNFFQGISFRDLYRLCRKAFLVNADLTLRAQLTEFHDHKLMKSRRGVDGQEYLIIPLDNSTLKEFLEQQKGIEKED